MTDVETLVGELDRGKVMWEAAGIKEWKLERWERYKASIRCAGAELQAAWALGEGGPEGAEFRRMRRATASLHALRTLGVQGHNLGWQAVCRKWGAWVGQWDSDWPRMQARGRSNPSQPKPQRTAAGKKA